MSQGFSATSQPQALRAILPVVWLPANPSVVATEGCLGQMGIFGSQYFRKTDNGITTNWDKINSPQAYLGYYPVSPVGPFTTIQSAINKAVLDGFGGLNPAVVEVYPGVYTEDVVMENGIFVISSSFGGAIVDGSFTYTVPAGGIPPGSSMNISGIFIRQQAGKNAVLVTAAPGDFGIVVLDSVVVISFIPAETFSAIDVQGNTVGLNIDNVRGFALSNDPGYYFLKTGCMFCNLRNTFFQLNSKFGQVVSGNMNILSSYFSSDSGLPLFSVEPGAQLSMTGTQILALAAGPQTPIIVAAGGTFYSSHNTYLVTVDAGSKCVDGAGNFNYANDVYVFSDQISIGLTTTVLDTIPTPI